MINNLSQAVEEASKILNNKSDILHKKKDFLEKRINLLENRKKKVEKSKRFYSFDYNKRANKLLYKIDKKLTEKNYLLNNIQIEINQVGLGKTYLYLCY
jgi:uncharacterized protein involved in exopolysaccharide biosynthesis